MACFRHSDSGSAAALAAKSHQTATTRVLMCDVRRNLSPFVRMEAKPRFAAPLGLWLELRQHSSFGGA